MLGRLGKTTVSNQAVVLAALNASLVNGAPPPTDDSGGMKDKDASFANLDPAGENIKKLSRELFDVASAAHPSGAFSDLSGGQDSGDALLEETVVQAERGYRNKGERWIHAHVQGQVVMLRNMLGEKNTFCGGGSASPLIRCSMCGAEDGCDVSAAEGGRYCRPQQSTARSHPKSGRLSATELERACSSLTVGVGEMVLVRRNELYERARLMYLSNTLEGHWAVRYEDGTTRIEPQADLRPTPQTRQPLNKADPVTVIRMGEPTGLQWPRTSLIRALLALERGHPRCNHEKATEGGTGLQCLVCASMFESAAARGKHVSRCIKQANGTYGVKKVAPVGVADSKVDGKWYRGRGLGAGGRGGPAPGRVKNKGPWRAMRGAKAGTAASGTPTTRLLWGPQRGLRVESALATGMERVPRGPGLRPPGRIPTHQ
jgi:hypothetical protein